MERRMIQSDLVYWVRGLSPTDKEALATKDRSRSLTVVNAEGESNEA